MPFVLGGKCYEMNQQFSNRVTSLEQLSVAEFSGEKARPKFYEKGHKNTQKTRILFIEVSKYVCQFNSLGAHVY